MKNAIYIFYFVLVAAVVSSCAKELQRPDRGYPRIVDIYASELTDNSLIMNLEIEGGDASNIIEYGFQLIPLDSDFSGKRIEYIYSDSPSGKTIQETINSDLPIGQILVGSYIQTSDKIVSGPSTEIISKGGLPPVITNIGPSTASPGDTLCIEGTGFGSIFGVNFINIDGTQIEPISYSKTLLKFIVPSNVTSNPSISVTSWGKESVVFTSVQTTAPGIQNINPIAQSRDLPITIVGFNFSPIISMNEVTFIGADSETIAEIISSTEDSIIIQVPFLNSPNNSLFDIKVTVDGISSTIRNAFEFKKPVLNISQDSLSYCDTLTIRGQNFSPIAENNELFFNTPYTPINIISSSTTELKVIFNQLSHSRLEEIVRFEKPKLKLLYEAASASSEAIFEIAAPKITSISPFEVNSRENINIVLQGNNFNELTGTYTITFSFDNTTNITTFASSASCDEIVIPIAPEQLPPTPINQVVRLLISYPGGCLEQDVSFNLD